MSICNKERLKRLYYLSLGGVFPSLYFTMFYISTALDQNRYKLINHRAQSIVTIQSIDIQKVLRERRKVSYELI